MTIITYRYKGITASGEKISGLLTARALSLAKTELGEKGIVIKKISRKPARLFTFGKRKITKSDITLLTRQLSAMLKAGIPLLSCLNILEKSQSVLALTKILIALQNDLEKGLTFAQALKKHPQYFNALFCNLVDAGEKSGTLEIMLVRIASYREKTQSLTRKIRKALTYPAAVFLIALIVTVGLLIFVIPEFESLYKSFGANLPLMTLFVISLSKILQKYGLLLFAVAVAGFYAYRYFRRNSQAFAHSLEKNLLKIPSIGILLKKASIASFARTLSITFAAGLSLIESLECAKAAAFNLVYANAADTIKEKLLNGQTLHKSFEETDLFPDMVVQMVTIGEESATLETMLTKVADFYEEEIDSMMDTLNNLLEPFIMALLGILIGGLVMALYWPIFTLGSLV